MGNRRGLVSNLGLPEVFTNFIKKIGVSTHCIHHKQMPCLQSFKARTPWCIPTASGKSFGSIHGNRQSVIDGQSSSRGIYIVPLKALATEKLEELKQLGESLGLKIGLGIGDAPSETRQIDDCDILVCTSEKLDSLMRSKAEVLRRVSVVVADEFHLLNDSHRGPTGN